MRLLHNHLGDDKNVRPRTTPLNPVAPSPHAVITDGKLVAALASGLERRAPDCTSVSASPAAVSAESESRTASGPVGKNEQVSDSFARTVNAQTA